MNEELQRQLLRQLRLLNIWMSAFGIILLVGFLVLGILIYKVVSFAHDTSGKLDAIQSKTQQSLNIKQKVCGNSSLSNFVERNSEICN